MAANDYSDESTFSSFSLSNFELMATVLNIYKFGSTTVPEYYGSHIRDEHPEFTVMFDSTEFLSSSGPGRYVLASDFPIMSELFGYHQTQLLSIRDGLRDVLGNINQTTFTAKELLESGYFEEGDFYYSLQHKDIDAGSDDYAVRTFLFNTQGFVIDEDTVFNITESGLTVQNLRISMAEEDFDFISNGGFFPNGLNSIRDLMDFNFAQFGNALILEPAFDPFGLGEKDGTDVPVLFRYSGEGRVYNGNYTASDYTNDVSNSAPPRWWKWHIFISYPLSDTSFHRCISVKHWKGFRWQGS